MGIYSIVTNVNHICSLHIACDKSYFILISCLSYRSIILP
jgi:hypothetical protein